MRKYQLPEGTNINWNQTDGTIGKQLNKSLVVVRRLRKEAGAPSLRRGRPSSRAVIA